MITKQNKKIKNGKEKLKNSVLETKERHKIIPYSLKKIKINPNLPNSKLKPLINSLSPSAKSKGARFISATQQIHHKGKIKIVTDNVSKKTMSSKFNLEMNNKGLNKITTSVISYLTLCLLARNLPTIPNLEEEKQPEKTIK